MLGERKPVLARMQVQVHMFVEDSSVWIGESKREREREVRSRTVESRRNQYLWSPTPVTRHSENIPPLYHPIISLNASPPPAKLPFSTLPHHFFIVAPSLLSTDRSRLCYLSIVTGTEIPEGMRNSKC